MSVEILKQQRPAWAAQVSDGFILLVINDGEWFYPAFSIGLGGEVRRSPERYATLHAARMHAPVYFQSYLVVLATEADQTVKGLTEDSEDGVVSAVIQPVTKKIFMPPNQVN